MKKIFLAVALIVLLGAGCAGEDPETNGNNAPGNVNSNVNSNTNTNANSNSNGNGNDNGNANSNSNSNSNGNANANVPPVPPDDLTLEPLPEVKPPKNPIDVAAWSKMETRAGVTIVFPTTGGFSPFWSYQSVSSDDPHLRGNCYVTADTVYEKTSFTGFTDACQTTTAFGQGPGTRVDYFTFKTGNRINMVTFTRNYPAGYDMDEYGAVLDRIIREIDQG